MAQTILVVDDQASVRLMLQEYLREHGFRIETAADGRQALCAARHTPPDLILLDVMMPELDGYGFLRHYRREQHTPVILLTAKVEESDKVTGLDLGADDYVTKPFGLRELLARIRAVLRRSHGPPDGPAVVRAADLELDRARHHVAVGGAPVALTPTEFALLERLMTAPGRVYARTQLLETLRGVTPDAIERTIDVHIRNLRAKIEPTPRQPRYVQTVYGVGYRFAAA